MNKSSATFSIVIPAWNESDCIEATLEAAKNAASQQPYSGDIIVVDNNSTDDTGDKASRAGARVVFDPSNQIARARNAGAKASGARWLVFIDADTTVSSTLLTSSLQALSSGNVIGGGSTVALDRIVTGMPKLTLRFWNWWSVKSSTAAGCYIYCTKEAFESVGGFDEKYYAAEELHFSKRLRKLAKKRKQQFVIQTLAPIVSSARKIDWFSPWQVSKQVLLLLVPGATRSKLMCYLWYDRSKVPQDGGDG
ncbi:MAG: glycosyltransferase [Granulosicoccaceae bacterium]